MYKIIKYMLFLFMLFGQIVLSAKIYDTLNYYKTLEVATDASSTDIKVAYKRLALLWHPDKQKDSKEATSKFAEIGSAYSVLSDPVERALYDATLPEEPSKASNNNAGTSHDAEQKSSKARSNTAFKMWVANLKKSFAERNKTKMVVCGAVVTGLTFIGVLKIIQLCIKKDKTFTLGTFEIHLPPTGNATLGKQGLCSFSCPIPL